MLGDMRSVHENIGRVSRDTCFMCHSGRRIWSLHSFSCTTQDQVIRQNFETPNFLLITYLPCYVWSQDSKNVFCFDFGQLQKQKKNAFQSSDVFTLTYFLGHCTAKIKILAWNVVHLLLVYGCMPYISCFFGYLKKKYCVCFYFWKVNFDFFV